MSDIRFAGFVGRILGVAEDCTHPLAFRVLRPSGKVIIRKDVWGIPADIQKKPEFIEELRCFDESVKKAIGDSMTDKEMDPDIAEGLPLPPGDLFFEDEETATPVDDKFL